MLVSVPTSVVTKRRSPPLEGHRKEEMCWLCDGGLEERKDEGLDGRKEGRKEMCWLYEGELEERKEKTRRSLRATSR